MSAFVFCGSPLHDLSITSFETNSKLWEVREVGKEPVLQLVNNKAVDHVGGNVALFKQPIINYSMRAEMRFIDHHLTEGSGGWFGFVMRARDVNNYELVWLMPNAEGENAVAYLSVAHGVVPWWTEAYGCQQKGKAVIPKDEWFLAQVDVFADQFTLYVEGTQIFTKKLTYYLNEGYPGFYVGTATDAAFRRVEIERLEQV